MAVSTGDPRPEIRKWLQENVTGSSEVSDDYPLIENGVLTSLQTVELVMFHLLYLDSDVPHGPLHTRVSQRHSALLNLRLHQ